MSTKIIQFIQMLYSKGYIELGVITIGTWIYSLFNKSKKTKYSRFKCPKCKQLICLKDGKPYTPKSRSKKKIDA